MKAYEFITEALTPATIHKLADRTGVKWDNEPSFLRLTKRLTGKEHLDDLNQTELQKVKQYLEKQAVTEGLDQSLSSMAGQDQAERNAYKAWVKAQPGAIMSAEMGAKYAQLKNRSKDDVFGDAVRQDKFMKMKFNFDKFTDKDWKDYWAMAQHCDKNRDFQKNALSIIKKYQGEDHIDRHYQYLYDRISCGTTGKQKYGTQDICGKDKQAVTEGLTETTSQLGPQLYTPHPKNLDESMKPEAALWTSTASSSNNGYTSAWVEWAKSEMPQWIGHSGFLYDVSPSARILTINSDQDAMRVAKKYGMNTTDIMDLFMYMPWKKIAKDYDAIHHVPSNRGADLFMHSWDVESTAWFNTKMLLNKRKVPILASKQGNLAPVKLR